MACFNLHDFIEFFTLLNKGSFLKVAISVYKEDRDPVHTAKYN